MFKEREMSFAQDLRHAFSGLYVAIPVAENSDVAGDLLFVTTYMLKLLRDITADSEDPGAYGETLQVVTQVLERNNVNIDNWLKFIEEQFNG